MSKSFIRSLAVSAVAVVAVAGIASAASTLDITGRLGGKTGDFFDLNGTLLADSIKIGSQGVGGVTFFNGTIVNNTTGSSNEDNPVTFGDNVRIDGELFRGTTRGPGGDQPLKLNDDVRVFGNLTVDSGKSITVTGANFTGLSSDDLSDVAQVGRLNEAETIATNWVNTAYPWAGDEIADVTRSVPLPLTTFLVDADGTPTPLQPATTNPNLMYAADQGLYIRYQEDSTNDMGTQFIVPDDYASGGILKAVVDTSGAIVTNWDLDYKVAIGQTVGTGAWDDTVDDEAAINVPDSPGTPNVVSFPITGQPNLSAGDSVFFDLFPANNTGAGEPDVEIYNVWFEYTAKQ